MGSSADRFGRREENLTIPGSLRCVLSKVRRFIPRCLLDGPWWDRLLDGVGHLPGSAAARGVGFEFPLSDAHPAADFFVAMMPGDALVRHYADSASDAAPGSASAALGEVMDRLLRREARAPHARPDWLIRLMLEYDIRQTEPLGRSDPGVFFKLRRPSGPGEQGSGPLTPGALATAMSEAVGWNDHAEERRAVERVFAALPARATVGEIGAMPGREPRGIRLIVDGVETAEIPLFLERLAWAGPTEAAMGVLAEMRDVVSPRARLSLDVTARGVAPRLGLEFYAAGEPGTPRIWTSTRAETWAPIVERLETLTWCRREKCFGLRRFPGLDHIIDQTGVFVLYRGVNHVKVVVENDTLSAKAYAGLKFIPYTPPPPAS